MRKMMILTVGATAVALALTFNGAMAGGAGCKSSASAASGCSGSKVEKAAMSGGHCATGADKAAMTSMSCCPIDRASLDRQAPGSKATFETAGDGIALVVTAASAQYVSAVQLAVNTNYETMKAHLATMKASCTTEKASMSGASCSMSESKVSKASAGSSCCMSKSADKAAMTEKVSAEKGAACASAASAGLCTDISKAWCCADMKFEKTSNGARIIWTSAKPEVVKSLRAAADHMKACPMMAGL